MRSLHTVTLAGVVVETWPEAIPLAFDGPPKTGAQLALLQPANDRLVGLFRRMKSGDLVVASGLIWLAPETTTRGPALVLSCYRVLIAGRSTVPDEARAAIRALAPDRVVRGE